MSGSQNTKEVSNLKQEDKRKSIRMFVCKRDSKRENERDGKRNPTKATEAPSCTPERRSNFCSLCETHHISPLLKGLVD